MKSKTLFFLALMIFASWSVFANNPGNPSDKIKNSKDEIINELFELNKLDEFIGKEYNYDKLLQEQPQMIKDAGLSSEMEFDTIGGENPPLGIPGFLWGFCLGLIGMLIVYLAMSEGPDRKKQVNSALYGCLTWSVLYLILILTGVIKFSSVEPKVIEAVGSILVA